jgi:hypothetical protein
MRRRFFILVLLVEIHVGPVPITRADSIVLLEQKPDPHGFPRPAKGSRDVPLHTSLYFQLGFAARGSADSVIADSVAATIEPQDGQAVKLLTPGQKLAKGRSGWLKPTQDLGGKRSLAVYIDGDMALRPSTTYTVRIQAKSQKGGALKGDAGSWSFTTEVAPQTHTVLFALDLKREPVHWHGRFFSGFGNVLFCTTAESFAPTYDLMAEARKQHPRAWSLQRDFWMTGIEPKPGFLPVNLPNVVREHESRRIAAIDVQGDSATLRLEDIFGHAQYGIAANRPIAGDFHPGDEVIVADGDHSARTTVVKADDPPGTVVVKPLMPPAGGWQLAYAAPLPTKEDPDAPGLFALGGCSLHKLKPAGTPAYYWGRLDKEWDLAHRKYGRRLLPNFTDASPFLARDGRNWTTAKDYSEWHAAARAIAGHIIDRYGKNSLEFVWSVFNEPDLGPLFWRADWDELQVFYDYTVDAILRAFEDRGYDSDKVFIGGLELGAIFGANLRIREFLAHCSPRAQARGARPLNAAFADRRLDGKRSRRVEALCRAHGGKGTPCDFVSIHSYNRSEVMAAKLIRAKEEALEVDAEFYRNLWVNSHESCPEWMPPPDVAAADSYLGNGYFPTWCADVVRRQLRQAVRDPRFAFGETILTVWPPPQNFMGLNAVTRMINVDDDGDGITDRRVTIPMPILHVLGLLSDMGDDYWVFPDRQVGGHTVSGFASRDDRAIRVLLYAQNPGDTQSRSRTDFEVQLDLTGISGREARIRQYRFDKDDNSYFRRAVVLRDRPLAQTAAQTEALNAAVRDLEKPELQMAALKTLEALGPVAVSALPKLIPLISEAKDGTLKALAQSVVRRAMSPPAIPRADVDAVTELSALRVSSTTTRSIEAGGRLRVPAPVAGNGLNILVIEPH